MSSIIAAMCAFATALSPVSELIPRGIELRYWRPLGQVAEYRLLLEVSGEQISLGERRPVLMSAEMALTEEVIAHGPDGTMWLRVSARPVTIRGAGGTFASLWRGEWPHLQVRMTAQGNILDVSLATGESRAGALERSFIALMSQPSAVVLPARRVAAGDEWEWEESDARQWARLVGIRDEGDERVARIVGESRSPLALAERSEALGLTTRLAGEILQQSELDLLVARGMVARHEGHTLVRTNSEVTLELPEGPRTFQMQSRLEIDFHLRLMRIDGNNVSLP